jgi:dTDP-4-amino-4,6-dideoxygalactose transaminase
MMRSFVHQPSTIANFPATEAAAARLLSLPMYAELTEPQIDYVAEALAAALK